MSGYFDAQSLLALDPAPPPLLTMFTTRDERDDGKPLERRNDAAAEKSRLKLLLFKSIAAVPRCKKRCAKVPLIEGELGVQQ